MVTKESNVSENHIASISRVDEYAKDGVTIRKTENTAVRTPNPTQNLKIHFRSSASNFNILEKTAE
jgi:hypothetical protein